MRVGLVSYWFNRGQATVARQLRSALAELGHDTHVLARPTKQGFFKPSYIETGDVWDQPQVTPGSAFSMPVSEYERWARACDLDAVVLLQNDQFDAVATLRHQGIRTLGWFAWEAFGPEHLDAATKAYDVIFSLNRCQQQRYARRASRAPLCDGGAIRSCWEPRIPRRPGDLPLSRRIPVAPQAARGDGRRLPPGPR